MINWARNSLRAASENLIVKFYFFSRKLAFILCSILNLPFISYEYFLTPTCATVSRNIEPKNIMGKYHFEAKIWAVKYRNRPLKVPLIFYYINFGEFKLFLIRPEIDYFDASSCYMHLEQHLDQIQTY
jgi:hypothetical protein